MKSLSSFSSYVCCFSSGFFFLNQLSIVSEDLIYTESPVFSDIYVYRYRSVVVATLVTSFFEVAVGLLLEFGVVVVLPVKAGLAVVLCEQV